jgi:pimeloyl-ACP methyl ester carboxylesterase
MGDTVARSGMYTLTQNIRASGIRAEVYNPAYWRAAADDLLAQPGAAEVPVAVAGYSMGGEAATRFAERLRSAGIPVQTLLAFEAYKPAPVACNVRRVIDMYGAAGPLRMSTRLEPGKAFTGNIEQVDWSKLSPDGRHDHLGVSKEPAALRYVQNALIGEGRVRMSAPSPGEASCLGKPAEKQTVANSAIREAP